MLPSGESAGNENCGEPKLFREADCFSRSAGVSARSEALLGWVIYQRWARPLPPSGLDTSDFGLRTSTLPRSPIRVRLPRAGVFAGALALALGLGQRLLLIHLAEQ
jgi:hypothetical protein